MPYQLKKDHVTNWNANQSNEKPIFNDDENTYISERSSTRSLDRITPSPRSNNKRLSTPTVPKNEPHKLRYDYNELPENGVPLATQVKNAQKEEKKRKQNIRKAPPGQGSLIPFPETKPDEMADNYYPYWYAYKLKHPDWIMRHRQTADGQFIPYDHVDPSKYVHKPASPDTSKPPRRHHRKSRRHDAPTMQYNQDQQRYETTQRTIRSSHLTPRENYDQQQSSTKQYVPLNDTDYGQRSDQLNTRSTSEQHGKLKTENDWNDHYNQSKTHKTSQDSHNQTIASDTSSRRSKHRSKNMNNNLPDENKNHDQTPPDSQHHHHHRHHRHHRHHHHHHHDEHYSPVKLYVDTEFQVNDASFKKSERSPFFQQTQNPFHIPPPAIYDQSSYLPPITRDHDYRPYPTDYYGTGTLSADWRRDSLKSPKIYKSDPKTNFYDHYLNTVIKKKLIT